MTLYELTEEFLQLLELAEDPETDPQVFDDTMEAIGGDIEVKADGYARVIRQIEANIAGIKAEEDRLCKRRKSMENNIKRMKEVLQISMTVTGKTKFKTDLFSFGIQKNPPSLKIDDPARIPDDFLIQPDPVPDSKAIKTALKEGFDFTWCHLEQSESLRIR